MSYKDWRAVYIDKSKTFEAWRAEKDAQYKAADSLTSTAPRGNFNYNLNLPLTKELQKVVATITPSSTLGRLLGKYATAEYVCIDETSKKFMFYDVNTGKIFYNPKHANAPFYDVIKSLVHEITHLIDYDFGISVSLSKEIFIATEEVKKTIFCRRATYEKLMLSELGENMAVSDLVSAFTDSEVYGAFAHDKEYWSTIGNREREIVAELATIHYSDDKEGIAFVESFPALKKLFEEVKLYYERSTEIAT